MSKAVRSILFGQLCFLCGLIACVILKPDGLRVNDGISYYGIFRQTFFPYAVGLLGGAYFAVHAIGDIAAEELQPVRVALRIYAPLIVGIVITPYAAGHYMDLLHTVCGATLFSLQLLLSGWLVWKARWPRWGTLLLVIELVAGILSAAFLNPTHGFLMQSQVIFQLAFGALLVLSIARLAPASPNAQ